MQGFHRVLIPVQAAYLPVKGLQQLIKTVAVVKKRLNKKLSIEGILITMVDYRTNYAKDITEMLRESYGDTVGVMEPVKGGSLENLPEEADKILRDLHGGSNASYAIRFAASFPNMAMVLSALCF